MAEEKPDRWKKAANSVIKAGVLRFPVTETFLNILKFYLTDAEADFIGQTFKMKTSQNMEELLKSTKGMAEADIVKMCDGLAKKGFIFNQPNSAGMMVYRLLPLEVVGVFEYTFMRPLPKGADLEKLKKVAKLYEKLLSELSAAVQGNYDNFLLVFKSQPPTDRTVPIYENSDGKEIKIEQDMGEVGEKIAISKNVADVINKFDDIAVGNCFCRTFSTLVGKGCKTNAPIEVCFTFGKSARHVTKQGFARKISKEEALKILKQTDDAGLVHKFFHNKSDVKEIENSMCNCCTDCCDTFKYWRLGSTPIVNYSTYLAKIDADTCTGCGTCEERCPMGSAKVEDDKAHVNEELCIGCGICAHFCPAEAISLLEKPRTVFVPPPRL
nr:4Fe-4S binding protein [Candidatus Sigynarchaeota archaeon]